MRALNHNGLPLKLVDLLAAEGTAWRADELADRLTAPRDSVNRALERLRDRGLVESRQDWVAYERKPRIEIEVPVMVWRVTDAGREAL